jgi:hypothetical protein
VGQGPVERQAVELRRAVLAAWALAGATVVAQSGEPGSVEVAAGVGTILNGGVHPAAGVSAGIATTAHLMPAVELWYLPLGSGLVKTGDFQLGRLGRISDSRAIDFHGALHLSVPVGSSRATPYLAFGAGLVRQSFTALGVARGTTGLTANFGGGLRWYISGRFGVRPELRVYAPDRTFVRVGVSLFYRSR